MPAGASIAFQGGHLVWDDTGFGAWDYFGGPIEMPNMSKLAANGLRYTQFHTVVNAEHTPLLHQNGSIIASRRVV